MASTVIDLALNLRAAVNEYSTCQLWIFIQSNPWKAFLSGCEDLMAFLEFSGHPLTASRVFQGLTDIYKAMEEEDNKNYESMRREMLLSLIRSINRFNILCFIEFNSCLKI